MSTGWHPTIFTDSHATWNQEEKIFVQLEPAQAYHTIYIIYQKSHTHKYIYKKEPTKTCCIAQGTKHCVITYKGKASEKEFVYITGLLCYIHLKLQDTINQLHFNFKK